MKIMNDEHPDWELFLDRLEGKDCCNFREDDNGRIIWTCKGGEDKTFARKIMEDMGNIDIEASCEWFNEHGGYCDCEILFNCVKED